MITLIIRRRQWSRVRRRVRRMRMRRSKEVEQYKNRTFTKGWGKNMLNIILKTMLLTGLGGNTNLFRSMFWLCSFYFLYFLHVFFYKCHHAGITTPGHCCTRGHHAAARGWAAHLDVRDSVRSSWLPPCWRAGAMLLLCSILLCWSCTIGGEATKGWAAAALGFRLHPLLRPRQLQPQGGGHAA